MATKTKEASKKIISQEVVDEIKQVEADRKRAEEGDASCPDCACRLKINGKDLVFVRHAR